MTEPVESELDHPALDFETGIATFNDFDFQTHAAGSARRSWPSGPCGSLRNAGLRPARTIQMKSSRIIVCRHANLELFEGNNTLLLAESGFGERSPVPEGFPF